jgi:alpha-N-arabinofuranosidase
MYNIVYWVASHNTASNTFFVKLANYGTAQQTLTITIPGTTTGTLTTLTGPATGSENIPGGDTVVPASRAITGSGGVFTFTMSAWSVAVLAVH